MRKVVRYKNGNYNVVFDMESGTKIRYNDEDELIPNRPESMDVTISKKCNAGCRFCYANCTPNGKHADIMSYSFIDNLEPYTELALNGNEPLHPDLVPFLEKCKKLKLIPSLTVNDKTFFDNIEMLLDLSCDNLLYGLGVSVHEIDDVLINNLKHFPNAVVHMIDGVHSIEDFESLAYNDLKVLVLGYKQVGRGIEYYDKVKFDVMVKQKELYDNIGRIVDDGWFNVISFDNLAIEQLDLHRFMSDEEWSRFYMGDDGTMSMYIDMVDGYFSKNSMYDVHYDLINDPISMFNTIRNCEK